MQSVAGHCWKGLILEDLSRFSPLSIHNVSGTVVSSALKALSKVHSAFVQHGNLARQHVMLHPETGRVVWVDFSCASCGEGAVSRQSLFHELAQTWSLLYEKLVSGFPFHRTVKSDKGLYSSRMPSSASTTIVR